MPLIYLNDLRLNAVIDGPVDGPAVVFLHALGTNLSIWDQVVDLLPKSLRTLRIDQRGHGASDVPEPPYSMGALVRDAERMSISACARRSSSACRWAGWWRRGWR